MLRLVGYFSAYTVLFHRIVTLIIYHWKWSFDFHLNHDSKWLFFCWCYVYHIEAKLETFPFFLFNNGEIVSKSVFNTVRGRIKVCPDFFFQVENVYLFEISFENGFCKTGKHFSLGKNQDIHLLKISKCFRYTKQKMRKYIQSHTAVYLNSFFRKCCNFRISLHTDIDGKVLPKLYSMVLLFFLYIYILDETSIFDWRRYWHTKIICFWEGGPKFLIGSVRVKNIGESKHKR